MAVDCIPSEPSYMEDPSVGVAVNCILPGPSYMEDPAVDPLFGLTDGGLHMRGLSSQGSLVVVNVVERVVFIAGSR